MYIMYVLCISVNINSVRMNLYLLKYNSIGTRICLYDYVSVFINVRKFICLCISKDLYSHAKINYYCNTLPVAMSQLDVCLSRLTLLLSTLFCMFIALTFLMMTVRI